MLTHVIMQYQKIMLVNITMDLIKKVFKNWEAVELMVVDTSLPKL